MEISINYIAVVVAGLSSMVVGSLWFGPLGKQWIAAQGWTEAQVAEGMAKMKKEGWKTYGMQAIASLVMAFVLAHSLEFASSFLGISGIRAGLEAGFWNWLGFIVPVTLGTVLWDGKPWKLWFITAPYYLVTLLVMGVILSLWQ